MRGSAWCQEDFTGRVAALLHGIVWGGCPGETDGRRHPAPVSPPCDLVGACWQCPSWPLPRLPSGPDPHSGIGSFPYMDPTLLILPTGEEPSFACHSAACKHLIVFN